MKYKAIFLDIDGTVMPHGKENIPSQRVTDAIQMCQKRGIAVSLATSRPPRISIPIIRHLGLVGFSVLSSGAQIYDASQDTMVIEKYIPPQAIQPIMFLAKEYGVDVKLYDGKTEALYTDTVIPKSVMGMYFPAIQKDLIEPLMKRLEGIEGIAVHRMESWDPQYTCIDVTEKSASKLHGIVEIGKLLHIPVSDMIGVGDGYNDFPLLMACGLKIAMGNAVPELKAIADFVAPSVDEDGVAMVIETFILNQ